MTRNFLFCHSVLANTTHAKASCLCLRLQALSLVEIFFFLRIARMFTEQLNTERAHLIFFANTSLKSNLKALRSSDISICNESQQFYEIVCLWDNALTLWLRALFWLDSSPHCVNASHRVQNNTVSFLKRNKKFSPVSSLFLFIVCQYEVPTNQLPPGATEDHNFICNNLQQSHNAISYVIFARARFVLKIAYSRKTQHTPKY